MNFEDVEYNNDSANSPQEFHKTSEQWISEGDAHYKSGLYQAALGAYELAAESRTSVLRTFVPADSKTVWRGLIEQGVTESDLARIVF